MLDMKKLWVPGLIYNQNRKVAELLYGDILISVFINNEIPNELEVTADTVDGQGDFCNNIEWMTCKSSDNSEFPDNGAYDLVITYIRYFIKQEYKRRNNHGKL